jgi:Flp pilus assembly protein TadB
VNQVIPVAVCPFVVSASVLMLLLFEKVLFAQLALLLFLISFWVFRVVERKERAERIARSKAEYLDGDSKTTA